MATECWIRELLGEEISDHISCGFLLECDVFVDQDAIADKMVSNVEMLDSWMLLVASGNFNTRFVILEYYSCMFLSEAEFT
jgi:hypothetical protein